MIVTKSKYSPEKEKDNKRDKKQKHFLDEA